MKDLIKALQIFLKYGNPKSPTCCDYEILYIVGIEPEKVSKKDKEKLKKLGFVVDEEEEQFISFEYGRPYY